MHISTTYRERPRVQCVRVGCLDNDIRGLVSLEFVSITVPGGSSEVWLV